MTQAMDVACLTCSPGLEPPVCRRHKEVKPGTIDRRALVHTVHTFSTTSLSKYRDLCFHRSSPETGPVQNRCQPYTLDIGAERYRYVCILVKILARITGVLEEVEARKQKTM